MTNRLPNEDESFLGTAKLAQRWDCCKLTLRRLTASEAIPLPIRIGGRLKWRLSDLQRFEQELQEATLNETRAEKVEAFEAEQSGDSQSTLNDSIEKVEA